MLADAAISGTDRRQYLIYSQHAFKDSPEQMQVRFVSACVPYPGIQVAL